MLRTVDFCQHGAHAASYLTRSAGKPLAPTEPIAYAACGTQARRRRAFWDPASPVESALPRIARATAVGAAVFATKPALASRMIGRALDGGVPAGWVAGDEVYGGNPTLRADLETRRLGYVLAVACDHRVSTAAGTCRADELVGRLPKRAWQRLSAEKGAKGHRFYDRAWIGLAASGDEPAGQRWLLVWRNRRTGELAFYRCCAPGRVPLATLVRVAGRQWTVEESFQTSKGQTGLDEHQCRTWRSWYRWTTLVLLAHAFLAIVRVTARASPAPSGLIPLTLNEIRHLCNALVVTPAANIAHILHWSYWAAATNTASNKPTTSDNRSRSHEDHDLRLE
ncbi:transposase [Kutzneria buriramensis]|uniref:IS701 family transposase n=1 Tax=Kutzneria buriramensis TaxID=1045776 RepID=UPI000E25EEB8|nr:transposase [Kutzneria buriramensis]